MKPSFYFCAPFKQDMKKIFVLGVLFALPIVAYIFFASGKNNFAKLPTMTKGVKDVAAFESLSGEPVTFKDHISVVAFLGSDLDEIEGLTFNLDQKILKQYSAFNEFQFVIILPESARPQVQDFVKKFARVGTSDQWRFAFGSPAEIREVFSSLKSDLSLNEDVYTPYVFIIDKDMNLRGRDDDEDKGDLYGYDASSIAELSNKMNDDVKIILAEYRLALKKYNKDRKN